MSGSERTRRLRWRCRRGMKELDVLLERFLAQQAEPLAQGEWPELEALLDTEDDVLWDWLQNPAGRPDSAYRGLLEVIRNA